MMAILSLFTWEYAQIIVYMLQATEYRVLPFLKWYWRTTDFRSVKRRRNLDYTASARTLLIILRVGICLQIFAGLSFMYLWLRGSLPSGWMLGVSAIVSYPVVWAHLILVPLAFGRPLSNLKHKKNIKKAERIFTKHPGIKIAVAGSYGKTTMKELLHTVLGEGRKVASSPANKNTMTSLASFALSLSNDEDIIIAEYGEGKPGDIRRFTGMTKPTHGVITGIAPAHLDQYSSVESAAEDIFSLAGYLSQNDVFVNGESPSAARYIQEEYRVYNRAGLDGWRVSNLDVNIGGISFTLRKDKQTLNLTSRLLGRHQVGPLVAAAIIGSEVGMDSQMIERGVAKTLPYEHRMQPYMLGGAWIIDDTYNGNIEGVKAGLELLDELPAERKIYVTPGLVDQGKVTEQIHNEIGKLIGMTGPDRVVLMDNSVAGYIYAGLSEIGYEGDVQVEEDPLAFYTNLDQFVAAGDLVLLQNDWTDNYY